MVDGAELPLAPGGITMVGSNGAGKSLLLKLLHRLAVPTLGRVLCRGQPLSPATREWQAQAPIAARGDDSGTHTTELQLWQGTGVDPTEASGGRYRETGSGMGATLNAAVGMEAYAMTDRATWISFANKGSFEVESGEDLVNQYGAILANPEECSSVNAEAGQTFIDCLSQEGQAAIGDDRVDRQQLFFPNAEG